MPRTFVGASLAAVTPYRWLSQMGYRRNFHTKRHRAMESDNSSHYLSHPHKKSGGTKTNMLSHSLPTDSPKVSNSTSPDFDLQQPIQLALTKIVNHILFTEWDPIDVHLLMDFDCRDEYQTYTPTIVDMVGTMTRDQAALALMS